MQVDIVVQTGGDDRIVASLYRWLAQDPDVARHTTVTLVPGPERAGDMGGAFEIINAVVANSIALSSLAVACATWRGSRGTATAPVVRITRGDVTVTVENGSPDEVSGIVDALGGTEPDSGAGTDGTDRP
ncbi:hypothetical protein ACIRNI_23055 [Streptomyces sp. NPDC093546]|uniref:effector-associated constant component EACC1 n=1 Tax=Streptomyces sp. NPDC093546 TaxID=3366040 RepID=UPI00381C512D